ncbi:TolC family protein [Aquitalea denitrificans]|uniref:TolC family protein n=1 Tax=Aquitalea denitrificans TaxID=519081 RepID=UPI00135BC661|nr:TolC family protein [Aquitalea denitrificans]
MAFFGKFFPLWLGLAVLSKLVLAESLQQAWQQAEQASNSLRAEARKVAGARQQEAASHAAAGPALTFDAGVSQLDSTPTARLDISPLSQGLGALGAHLPSTVDAPLSNRDVRYANARLSLPLYTGGRLAAMQQAAAAATSASQYAQEQARQSLRLQVAEAYFNVLRARHAASVASQYLQSLQSYQRDVNNFFRKGVVARGDVLGAELAVADAQQKQISARQAESLSQSAYNRLLGRDFSQPAQPDELSLSGDKRSLAELQDRALQMRPELAGLAEWSASLQASARSVRAESQPQVGVYAAYSYLNNPYLVNKGVGSVGLGVSWTVFDSGLIRARAGSASEQAMAIEDQLHEVQSLIALDVQRAHSQQIEAAERIKVAQAALQSADEFLSIQRDRYRNGLANQTEVLAAEARRADGQRNLFNARYDHALAVVGLQRAIGEL